MGKIILDSIYVPCSDEVRTLRVYLPQDYSDNSEQYKVLYIHDGQNVFEDKDATFGRSWRMKSYLNNNEINHLHENIVVVALDNSETRRYNEYSPWVCEKPKSNFKENEVYGGNGEEYGRFFAQDLRQYINKKYNVRNDFESTGICGSSMGGFITAYIAAKYSDIYSGVGVFSIASWFAEKEFLKYMRSSKNSGNQKIYIQVGDNETSDINNPYMKQWYVENSRNYYNVLKLLNNNGMGDINKNIKMQVNIGEKHNEEAWGNHIGEFLKFWI